MSDIDDYYPEFKDYEPEEPMSITCNRCGKDISEVNLVDSPYPNDSRLYCIDCYAHLFPPGWTDEYMPLKDVDAGLGQAGNYPLTLTQKCELCGGDLIWDGMPGYVCDVCSSEYDINLKRIPDRWDNLPPDERRKNAR